MNAEWKRQVTHLYDIIAQKDSTIEAALEVLDQGPDTWYQYQTREAGDVFLAEGVLDFTAELRNTLRGELIE